MTTDNLRNTDASGWLPIDFTQSPIQTLSALPIDPTNTTSSGLYYTYIPGGSFVFMSALESTKQKWQTYTDGGIRSGLYETGSDPKLGFSDSCKGILNAGRSVGDGVYSVVPNRFSGPQNVYCDMTTDGGGWTLLFQRKGGTNNIESCGSTLNSFLRNTCGDPSILTYSSSYSIDLDFTPRGKEFLFKQYDSSMVFDSDDAFIIHSENELWPDKLNTVENIPVTSVCNGVNSLCDSTDVYLNIVVIVILVVHRVKTDIPLVVMGGIMGTAIMV